MAEEGPIRFLVVDDDDVDVMNIRRAFEKNRVANSLFVATDGKEALDKLRSGEILRTGLIVLLDLRMPRMNGLEFLRVLRADPSLRSIPVVVLTTSADEGDREQAYRLNVAGYFLKPVSLNDFKQAMTTFSEYWSRVVFPNRSGRYPSAS